MRDEPEWIGGGDLSFIACGFLQTVQNNSAGAFVFWSWAVDVLTSAGWKKKFKVTRRQCDLSKMMKPNAARQKQNEERIVLAALISSNYKEG